MAADPPAGRRPRQCPVGDVSVIIPTRDAEPWLAAAVASVLAQGRRIGEVMICTDAADSPTSALVASGGDDRVRAVRAAGDRLDLKLNAGLRAAGGDWLAFLDADDLWPAGRLAAPMAAFAGTPGLEICFGRQLAMTADGVLGSRPAPARLLGTVLLRRETASRLGPFTTPALTSPMRWLLRAREPGLREAIVDHVLLHRRVHAGNMTRQSRGELHTAYLALVRDSLSARRRPGG